MPIDLIGPFHVTIDRPPLPVFSVTDGSITEYPERTTMYVSGIEGMHLFVAGMTVEVNDHAYTVTMIDPVDDLLVLYVEHQ